MTADKKKLAIIIGAVIAVILVAVIGYKVSRSIQQNKEEKERKEGLQLAIETGAKDLGVTDLTDIEVSRAKDDDGNENSYYITYAKSEQFCSLSYEEMVNFFMKLDLNATDYNPELGYFAQCIMFEDHNDGLRIISGGKEYMCSQDSSDISWRIYENGNEVFHYDPRKPQDKPASAEEGEKCPVCNGTGAAKYYYGGSDLEALIDGHEASWYGQCGSCQGTGIAK